MPDAELQSGSAGAAADQADRDIKIKYRHLTAGSRMASHDSESALEFLLHVVD